MTQIVSIDASLVNPNDNTEVNVVLSAAGVGTTHKLASGHVIKWTPDILRAKAHTLVGKPVNVQLDASGKATGHTRKVVGAVKEAHYDEATETVIATTALWGHYDPSTVKQLKALYAKEDLHPSMEYSFPEGTLIDNGDGTETPTDGEFSGLGFVGKSGDPRAMVYLMAALDEADEHNRESSLNEVIKEIVARLSGAQPEAQTSSNQDDLNAEIAAAHDGSFEWIARKVQEHLAAGQSEDSPSYHYMIATYPNYAIYQEGADYFRLDFKRSGDKLNFGEPQAVDPVYQPTAKASAEEGGIEPAEDTGTTSQGDTKDMSDTAEVQASEALAAATAQLTALQASLDAANATLDEMKTKEQAREAADAANTLADSRMSELEKIVTINEEAKAALRENLKSLDDAAYEVVKATFSSSADIAAGIAPGATIENPDPTGTDTKTVPAAEMEKLQKEAQAQFGSGQKSEDKE
jgi:hypothetical protein